MIGAQAPAGQNQPVNSNDDSVLEPDYSHRNMCSDSQDVMGYFESLRRNGFMEGGIISLNQRAYLAEGDSELYRDNAYYSLLAARMLFEDSQALTCAWIDAAGKGGQEHSRAGDSPGASLYPTTIDANILTSIQQITSQAINVLSSFTDVLAGKDPISTAQIMEWFDFITSAIKRIDAVKNQQA